MSRRMCRQIYWSYLNCILHLIYIFCYKYNNPTHFIYYKKIKTTLQKGSLLWGYKPIGKAGASRRSPSLMFRRITLASLTCPTKGLNFSYLANGSSYSFTLNLSTAWSCISCSLTYLRTVASFSPTV